MKCTGGDPRVCSVDWPASPLCFAFDLRPFDTQFAADVQDRVSRHMPNQFLPPDESPRALYRPALQLGYRHERDSKEPSANVHPKAFGSWIILEEHRDYIGVDNSGVHLSHSRGPSVRHSRSMAANSSAVSS